MYGNTNPALPMQCNAMQGFTRNAGPCLCTGVSRGGKSFVVVILGCANKAARYTDTLKLTRWAKAQVDM